jgi:AraC-like DNA-binding protein
MDRGQVVRVPSSPALARVVELAWDAPASPPSGARWERVVPTGKLHLVVRDGAPLRLAGGGAALGAAIVGGPRATAYDKDVSAPSSSVGVVLGLGVARALFGVPADALAEQHVALDDLVGTSEAARLRDRVLSPHEPSARLAALEAWLEARVVASGEALVDARVARGLARLAASPTATVSAMAAASGLGVRAFGRRFAASVGLSPRAYGRVVRLGRVVARLARTGPGSDAALALEAGYADQAHFCRELRAFLGMTPSEYRASRARHPHHVPLHASLRDVRPIRSSHASTDEARSASAGPALAVLRKRER